MLRYTHVSMTLWRIWETHFPVVQGQSAAKFDKEGNTYISCTTDGMVIFWTGRKCTIH
jgi:hypothetical protein